MNIQFQAGNGANWEEVWGGNFTAPSPPGDVKALERYYPIEEIIVPVQLDASLIAVYASSQSADTGWRYAGAVRQKVQTPLLVGGVPNAIGSNKRFWLDQWTLLTYTVSFGTEYGLIVKVPYWLRDITLQVWAYTGPVTHLA